MTLRQLWYVIQGQGVLPKTRRAYKRMCEYVGMARRSGRIPWESIRDDRQVAAEAPLAVAGPAHFWSVVGDLAADYRTDRRYVQSSRLELWSETEGVVPQLVRVGEPFGISTYSGSGFAGLKGKHDAAERAIAGGVKTVILHVGDHDPSGEWMLTALAEDVTAFAEVAGAEVEFVSIAVTPAQIERNHLPTALPRPLVLRHHHDPGRVAASRRAGRDRARGDRGPPRHDPPPAADRAGAGRAAGHHRPAERPAVRCWSAGGEGALESDRPCLQGGQRWTENSSDS
ncbi:hypothetical protein [Embleya sp. NPDC005575]|uniref:hypothetical protein n=1 Tax=Embleya sp. NPDC005575 TaxID=3156892 RepID=UPI0033AD6EB2